MIKPYFEQDGITIYHGDCREVLPTLPAGGVDLVLTSPPYNLGTTDGPGLPGERLGHYSASSKLGGRGGSTKWRGGELANGYGVHTDAMPHEEYVDFQKGILTECWRLLGPTGAIFYNHKPRILKGHLLTPLEYNPGLPIRQIVIWARSGGVNFSEVYYLPTCEWIVIFAKTPFRLKNKSVSRAGDVWHITQERDNPHPAPFPIALARTVLESTTAPVVLDPFMGSGTTLLAAQNLGRPAIGIDIEEKYCEMAAQRLASGRVWMP